MIKWNKNPDMVAYMKQIIPGHEESEIRAMFLEKFSIELRMLGHSQLSTTQIYLDLNDEQMKLMHQRYVR